MRAHDLYSYKTTRFILLTLVHHAEAPLTQSAVELNAINRCSKERIRWG
jgi:hypothetical protein